MGSLVPYRVDLFGDEVDSIRTFDPDSQRSLYPVPEVPPAARPRVPDGRSPPARPFARAWREKLEGDPTRSRIYKDIDQGIAGGGIEYYLPLFFDEAGTIFDYPGPGRRRARQPRSAGAARQGRRGAGGLLDRHPRASPLPAARPRTADPAAAGHLHAGEEFFQRTQAHATCRCAGRSQPIGAGRCPDLSIDRGATDPLGALEKHIKASPHRVLLVAESDGRRESLLELLRDHGIAVPSVESLEDFQSSPEKVAIATNPLAEGFHWHEPEQDTSIQFVTENRTVRHHAPGAQAAQAGTGQQCRCADQGPVGAEGRRPGGASRTTASGATRGW